MSETSTRALDDLWMALHGVQEWVRFADAKAGATLAVDGVLLALLTDDLRSPERSTALAIILAGGAAAAAAVSGLLAVWAVIPRLKMIRPWSVLYFDHAGRHDSAQAYRRTALPVVADPDLLADTLADQIWAFSNLARRKYFFVTRAVWSLLAAAVLGLPVTLIT